MDDHPNVWEYIGESSIRTGGSGRSIPGLSGKEELEWSTRMTRKHRLTDMNMNRVAGGYHAWWCDREFSSQETRSAAG
jgi:hypothetical protein